MNERALFFGLAIAASTASTTWRARAQEVPPPELGDTELSRKSQNPISDMASLPLEHQMSSGFGPRHLRSQLVLRLTPVVPVPVGRDWMVVTRSIVPFVDQPVAQGARSSGLGDIEVSLLATAARERKVTWGVGPVFQLATATSPDLGTGKWSVGPSAVVLTRRGAWIIGALSNDVWSYAGPSSRSAVHALLLQPFVGYDLPYGWSVRSDPTITANWVKADERWVVPVGATIAKTSRFGDYGLKAAVGLYLNPIRPADGPESQLRAQVAMLFPR
jgi:hypothetical protein